MIEKSFKFKDTAVTCTNCGNCFSRTCHENGMVSFACIGGRPVRNHCHIFNKDIDSNDIKYNQLVAKNCPHFVHCGIDMADLDNTEN